MINLKRPVKKTELQAVRTSAIAKLENLPPDSDEYKKIIAHVETLSKLIDAEKPEKLSRNTVAVILGNVGIAGMVLWFERDNVMNTKLFPFLGKPKT
jgi:hypothetical protein